MFDKLAIFSGNASCKLAGDICRQLRVKLGDALVTKFSEGEINVKINENVRGKDVFKLHLIPSGILYPEATCVIGDGVVLNPAVLIEELDNLKKKNINIENLRISCKAHMVMPYHVVLDKAREHRLGKSKIGTTHKGIGPVYSDKASRSGIRTQDLLDRKIFKTKLEEELSLKNAIIEKVYGMQPLDLEEIYEDYMLYAERIGKYIVDTAFLINGFLDQNKSVL